MEVGLGNLISMENGNFGVKDGWIGVLLRISELTCGPEFSNIDPIGSPILGLIRGDFTFCPGVWELFFPNFNGQDWVTCGSFLSFIPPVGVRNFQNLFGNDGELPSLGPSLGTFWVNVAPPLSEWGFQNEGLPFLGRKLQKLLDS